MSDVILAAAVVCQTLALMFALAWWQFVPAWVTLKNGKPPVFEIDFTRNRAWVKGTGEGKATDYLSCAGGCPALTENGLLITEGMFVTIGKGTP